MDKSISSRATEALAYLQQDSLLHMGMIDPIRRGTADILHHCSEGVLLHERQSGAMMLSSLHYSTGCAWLEALGRPALLCVHQKCFAEYICTKTSYVNQLTCLQAVYCVSDPLPLNGNYLQIHALPEEAATEIHGHYHAYADYTYIASRIACGELFGGYLDGVLCGFIGTHAEGSLGMLYVLPSYRRKGIASLLESFMVNRALAKGYVPYVQIDPTNEQSINLHLSLGFSLSPGQLYWFFDV